MRTTSTVRTAGLVVLAAAASVALAGCTGGPSGEPTATVTSTVSASSSPSSSSASASGGAAAPSATPTSTPTCGPSDGATAASGPIARLPLPTGLESARWDASTADTAAYDGCAALSAVTVTVADATASSPVAILLFHDGSYLGTATKEQYPFVPQVSRTAPDALRVVYTYATASDPNASPSGRATATYTWDASAGRVEMSGDVPPAS